MRIDVCPVLMRGTCGRGESPAGKISESRLMSEAAVDDDNTDMPRLREVDLLERPIVGAGVELG